MIYDTLCVKERRFIRYSWKKFWEKDSPSFKLITSLNITLKFYKVILHLHNTHFKPSKISCVILYFINEWKMKTYVSLAWLDFGSNYDLPVCVIVRIHFYVKRLLAAVDGVACPCPLYFTSHNKVCCENEEYISITMQISWTAVISFDPHHVSYFSYQTFWILN